MPLPSALFTSTKKDIPPVTAGFPYASMATKMNWTSAPTGMGPEDPTPTPLATTFSVAASPGSTVVTV
eukprot:7075355-Pyramimonas_sp.AAC.1